MPSGFSVAIATNQSSMAHAESAVSNTLIQTRAMPVTVGMRSSMVASPEMAKAPVKTQAERLAR